MNASSPADLVAAFRDRTLPKSAWTHEAHLVVCWDTLQSRTVDEAVEDLRGAIRAYNEVTGTPNTATSGYHETITRYYVEAVAHLNAGSLDDVLRAEGCGSRAPLAYWSPDLLFSSEARRRWVEPDLEPLPFR